jgi:hypothetical protein
MAEEAMMESVHNLWGAFAPACDVTITPLPFGGAVLVNGRTLTLLECAAPEAAMLGALLGAAGQRNGHSEQIDAVLESTARRLVDEGWIVANANANGGDER